MHPGHAGSGLIRAARSSDMQNIYSHCNSISEVRDAGSEGNLRW